MGQVLRKGEDRISLRDLGLRIGAHPMILRTILAEHDRRITQEGRAYVIGRADAEWLISRFREKHERFSLKAAVLRMST